MDWGAIAGSVLGTAANFVVPGSGSVVSGLVDAGVDAAIGAVGKKSGGGSKGRTGEWSMDPRKNTSRASQKVASASGGAVKSMPRTVAPVAPGGGKGAGTGLPSWALPAAALAAVVLFGK